VPFGLGLLGSYALAANRHQAVYGTTPEQLAAIAVATREWAKFNPLARFNNSLTIDEVLASPMICSPLHMLDCCLVTDGAGAVVVTSAERARDLAKPPVYVLGTATAHSHNMIHAMPDLTVTPGSLTGPRAMDRAGIRPSDVGLLMGYDSFTITALLHLEDLGFVQKGEAGAFVAAGETGPGGSLPMNTNGGGLSFTHPGMYGIFLLVEAARQLRGEAGGRQIDGLDVAVAHGSGQFLSAMSTVVLGTEAAL
jgi:acetyl-CoA acetyltransferase